MRFPAKKRGPSPLKSTHTKIPLRTATERKSLDHLNFSATQFIGLDWCVPLVWAGFCYSNDESNDDGDNNNNNKNNNKLSKLLNNSNNDGDDDDDKLSKFFIIYALS